MRQISAESDQNHRRHKKLIHEHKADKVSVDDSIIFAVTLKSTGEMIGEVVVMPVENTISLGYTFPIRFIGRAMLMRRF